MWPWGHVWKPGLAYPATVAALPPAWFFLGRILREGALFLSGSGRLLDASFFEDVEGDAKIAVAIVVAAVVVFLAAIETGRASA